MLLARLLIIREQHRPIPARRPANHKPNHVTGLRHSGKCQQPLLHLEAPAGDSADRRGCAADERTAAAEITSHYPSLTHTLRGRECPYVTQLPSESVCQGTLGLGTRSQWSCTIQRWGDTRAGTDGHMYPLVLLASSLCLGCQEERGQAVAAEGTAQLLDLCPDGHWLTAMRSAVDRGTRLPLRASNGSMWPDYIQIE